jgi:hypothetical protein
MASIFEVSMEDSLVAEDNDFTLDVLASRFLGPGNDTASDVPSGGLLLKRGLFGKIPLKLVILSETADSLQGEFTESNDEKNSAHLLSQAA